VRKPSNPQTRLFRSVYPPQWQTLVILSPKFSEEFGGDEWMRRRWTAENESTSGIDGSREGDETTENFTRERFAKNLARNQEMLNPRISCLSRRECGLTSEAAPDRQRWVWTRRYPALRRHSLDLANNIRPVTSRCLFCIRSWSLIFRHNTIRFELLRKPNTPEH